MMNIPENVAGSPPILSSGRAEWMWYVAALIIVIACGIPNLIFPFVADQAVAMAGAKTIAQGGILYVDFWDNKMPGLFWFYFVAGELFGYSELGVHILEIIWMGIFSLVLMATLRRYYFYPWLSAIAPIGVVGVYYVSVEPFYLTQLEMLVGFPIYLSAWFATRLPSSVTAFRWAFLASGICAGITVVFKLVFAPLFVVFWLVVSTHLLLSRRSKIVDLLVNLWLPVSVGVIVILIAVAAKFWLDDALGELLWTAFEYPPQALANSPPAPYYRLAESMRYFLTYYLAWSAFIAIAVVYWWRGDRDIFTSLLLAWLIGGFALILIQRFSWWPYHFLTLFPPAGILGVRGIGEFMRYVLRVSPPSRLSEMLLALLLVIPLVGAIAIPGGQKLTPYVMVFLKAEGGVSEFQMGVNNDYATIMRSTRFLAEKTALPGKIYVFGDPLYYHLSGRQPALPILGWAWEFFLQSQWVRLPQQLDETRPPYIYLNNHSRRIIEHRGAGVPEFIAERYIELTKDHAGSWFILRRPYR